MALIGHACHCKSLLGYAPSWTAHGQAHGPSTHPARHTAPPPAPPTSTAVQLQYSRRTLVRLPPERAWRARSCAIDWRRRPKLRRLAGHAWRVAFYSDPFRSQPRLAWSLVLSCAAGHGREKKKIKSADESFPQRRPDAPPPSVAFVYGAAPTVCSVARCPATPTAELRRRAAAFRGLLGGCGHVRTYRSARVSGCRLSGCRSSLSSCGALGGGVRTGGSWAAMGAPPDTASGTGVCMPPVRRAQAQLQATWAGMWPTWAGNI
jgi:hypothetical protein